MLYQFILGRIFAWPLKGILKLIGNSIVGGIIIFLINLIGANFGFHIGLNIGTALVVGILGIPGAILLIILTSSSPIFSLPSKTAITSSADCIDD